MFMHLNKPGSFKTSCILNKTGQQKTYNENILLYTSGPKVFYCRKGYQIYHSDYNLLSSELNLNIAHTDNLLRELNGHLIQVHVYKYTYRPED